MPSASSSPPASPERRPRDSAAGSVGDGALNLYIHWPFCRSKCPYCDFNSHIVETLDTGRWRQALVRELEAFAAETRGRTVGSVFFGGGTPSLMDPADVAAVLEAAARLWPIVEDCEITLEANPTSSEARLFRAFHDAGINRLSIGVQAFDDATLRFLGRTHDAATARRAVEAALGIVPRVSFDLIYAIPGQSVGAWAGHLAEAAALGPRHLSAYQLTVAPGTPFHRDGVAEVDDESGAALYETTQEVLAGAGLLAYEVSNHAAPGEECRHNLSVWRGGDYLPIGPGAQGRLGSGGACEALSQHRPPQRWLEAVEAKGLGFARRSPLSRGERAWELILLGLRLAEGLDRQRFRRLTGTELDVWLDGSEIARMAGLGLVDADDTTLRATPAGRQRLDWVLGRILR